MCFVCCVFGEQTIWRPFANYKTYENRYSSDLGKKKKHQIAAAPPPANFGIIVLRNRHCWHCVQSTLTTHRSLNEEKWMRTKPMLMTCQKSDPTTKWLNYKHQNTVYDGICEQVANMFHNECSFLFQISRKRHERDRFAMAKSPIRLVTRGRLQSGSFMNCAFPLHFIE